MCTTVNTDGKAKEPRAKTLTYPPTLNGGLNKSNCWSTVGKVCSLAADFVLQVLSLSFCELKDCGKKCFSRNMRIKEWYHLAVDLGRSPDRL